MKKIVDRVVQFSFILKRNRNETETKRNETNNNTPKNQKWKEVQLFSNCTSNHRKESEGLNLCSLFIRGAFLC